MTRLGTIDISELNTPPEKHELATAKFFANLGKDIKFIRPINVKGVHTPDFYMDGLAWEIKSPKTRNTTGIENNFRSAIKQSENIIFDLRRLKIADDKCINKIRKETKKRANVRRVKIITRNGVLLTIKK